MMGFVHEHRGPGKGPVQEHLTRNFLLLGGLRLFLTAVLGALYYLAIRLHQDRILTAGQKSAFDAIIVAISIALSLNLASSLREIAIHARRWVQEKHPVYVDQMEVHSFLGLLAFLRRTPYLALRIACTIWILLNLASQVAISVLNLTFTADPGIQDIYLDPSIGIVAVPNMTHFARVGRFNDGPRPQSVAAHILGNIGTSFEYSAVPPEEALTGAPVAKYPHSFWAARGDAHWELAFANSAPVPGPQGFNFLSVYSNQSVQSYATCRNPPYTFRFSPSTGTLAIQHTADMRSDPVLFPSLPVGEESITYLTKPVLDGNSTIPINPGACGPGCSTVHVVEPKAGKPAGEEGSGFVHPTSGFYYYECNVTVAVAPSSGEVAAGQVDFPAGNAAVAAQAIALSGQRAPSPDSGRLGTNQYAVYTFGLEFGTAQNNSATGMGRMLSRFAIGVVAAAAQTNPKILVPGNAPRQGVRLRLDKPVTFVAVVCGITGVQLVLMVAAAVVLP